MTELKLTWCEFVEKYQPKEGDKFFDDRGNEWFFRKLSQWQFFCTAEQTIFIKDGALGTVLTCPLIPPKANRKMFKALLICKRTERITESNYLCASLEEAEFFWDGDPDFTFHSWPAIPNEDGSYTVAE